MQAVLSSPTNGTQRKYGKISNSSNINVVLVFTIYKNIIIMFYCMNYIYYIIKHSLLAIFPYLKVSSKTNTNKYKLICMNYSAFIQKLTS